MFFKFHEKENEAAKMDDEDDPVEHEVNVYLSKSLSENLYLLQYPVRPRYMTYDSVDLLSGRVKPNQKKLELEVSLNTRSKHYAKSKGEQYALNVDGRNAEGSTFFSSDLMDKQVLHSSPALSDAGRYAIGHYKHGELYLSPVRAITQMKPGFDYLDKSDKRQESKDAAKDAGDSSQDEAEDDAQTVTVKFARPESEAAKARRLASYSYLQKLQDEESWVPLTYHNVHTSQAEQERRLLSGENKEQSNEFHVESAEYLKMLMAHADEKEHEKPAMPNNVLSLTQLKNMPLSDQVKALLNNAKVIRFSQLLHLLPLGTDPQATLRALQIAAVMVQGCWVVKSEILYPKDGISPNSGVSSDLLCRGRDFVMWRFTQSRCVTRKEIASVIKLPSEDVKDILEQMSRIKVNHGWEFVFPHDYEFTDRYPDITERQRMLWEAKYATLSKQLNISEAVEKKIREVAAAEAQAERPRRRRTSRTRKRTLSGRSISDHSDLEMDLDTDITSKDPLKNGHKLLNGETMEISDEALVTEVDSKLHKKELTDFIQDKLFSRYVLSMSELKRLLNVKLSQSPPGHVLSSGVTDKLCEQTVIELGGLPLKSKWQEESIFLHINMEDSLKPLRMLLLEFLNTSYKLLKKNFTKKVEASLGASVAEDDIKQVLRDYCVQRSNVWYIKCCADWT